MTQAAVTTIRLSVIGHTNAGKTSLLRTLIRDRGFGEVSIHPATTRHAEAASLDLGQGITLELTDTPGFEDPIGLLNLLHNQQPDPRMTGPIRLNHFLNSSEARGDFIQEAKAIRQLMNCDMSLYVADAREPVSGKYRDEFVLLNWSGKPCLVVLNFVANASGKEAWRKALAEAGLHNVVEFDSVVFNAVDEKRLLQQLAVLLPAAEEHVSRLLELRAGQRHQQLESAAVLIAEKLVQCSAIHVTGDEAAGEIKQTTREMELSMNRDLLKLFGFTEEDYSPGELPITGAEWDIDLFDTDVLSELGLSLGSSAAKGAAAGVTLDLLTGFTSLGMATLIGGAVGTGLDGVNRLKQYIDGSGQDDQVTQVSLESLRYMARRACMLVKDLARRGHASVKPVDLQADLSEELTGETLMSQIFQKARYQPDWVSGRNPDRQGTLISELAGLVRQNLPVD